MEFGNVKIEKANAMAKYLRNRDLENAFFFFNLCVALFVFSGSSWFPIALRLLSHSYNELVSLLNNPIYVFLIGNVIILCIYALSERNRVQNDVYDEFLDNIESRRKAATAAGDESPADSSVSEEDVSAVTETTMTKTTATAANGEKVLRRKCYRRVESEIHSRRRVGSYGGRELTRVKTEVSNEVVTRGGELERRLCYVENLSNEDFNRTVEDFIAKHRRMRLEEHREFSKTGQLNNLLTNGD